MAGTLSFRLQVDHVYQRRFDTGALDEVLQHSHWYLITRRPAVRIVRDSVHIQDRIITIDFTIGNRGEAGRLISLGYDLDAAPARNFNTYADGSYFSTQLGDKFLHGDAWALASFMSGADPGIAKQEVMYAGEAFGDSGDSNAQKRTLAHKKLQRVYEDHVADDWEIFVVPLSLNQVAVSSGDHILDREDGFDLSEYLQTFADSDGNLFKPSVDLVEHALVSHFVPPYNEQLRLWNPSAPTIPMKQMRSVGLRLLHVHLRGWWGLARFYSEREPRPVRSHSITRELVLDGSGFKRNEYAFESALIEEGSEFFENLAESTGVVLRAFGEQAPKSRKPESVELVHKSGAKGLKFHLIKSRHGRIRKKILSERERLLRDRTPRPFSGKSSYDPVTGSITIGYSETLDNVGKMSLHDVKTGDLHSTLIFGDAQAGKSSTMNLIGLEVAMTKKFAIVPSDPSGRNNFTSGMWDSLACRQIFELATDSAQTLDNLLRACRIIEFRNSKKIYTGIDGSATPIFLAIDDADAVLHDDLGARAVSKILSDGGRAGVCVALVVSDVAALESSQDLMRSLIGGCKNILGFSGDGAYLISDLKARYGQPRTRTWVDEVVTFVLHEGLDDAVVGVIRAVMDVQADSETALNWGRDIIQSTSVPWVDDWHAVGGHTNESWWTLDINASRWFLRHHSDCWVLIRAISNSGAHSCRGPEAIKWAEGVIKFRFDVDLTRWKGGPSVSEPDVLCLYSDAASDILVRDTREATKWSMMSRH